MAATVLADEAKVELLLKLVEKFRETYCWTARVFTPVTALSHWALLRWVRTLPSAVKIRMPATVFAPATEMGVPFVTLARSAP
jgi:hypothetical protein